MYTRTRQRAETAFAVNKDRRLGVVASRAQTQMPQGAWKQYSRARRLTVPPSLRMVFRAVVSTVVPEGVNLDEPGWAELERVVEETLSGRPRKLQRQLRLLLGGIQWLPVLAYGRTFTALDPARRARFLSTLEHHPAQLIRKGFFGLRTLAFLGYYGRPEAANAIGYAADPRGWEALR